jgi:excisionase family DNA binding protein
MCPYPPAHLETAPVSTATEQTQQTNPPAARRWASLREALAYSRLSERTLRRMARDGTIRLYKPRGKVLVDLNELDVALGGNAVPA